MVEGEHKLIGFYRLDGVEFKSAPDPKHKDIYVIAELDCRTVACNEKKCVWVTPHGDGTYTMALAYKMQPEWQKVARTFIGGLLDEIWPSGKS